MGEFVMIPQAVGVGVLHSQKPNSFIGDFDVARNSLGATYINKFGAIEEALPNVPRIDFSHLPYDLTKPRTSANLFLWSEDFSNAAWSKSGLGGGSAPQVTPNNAVAPNGTMTADTIEFNLNGNTDLSARSFLRQLTLEQVTSKTFSIWLKSSSNNNQKLLLHNGVDIDEFEVTPEWVRYEFPIVTGRFFAGLSLRGSVSTVDSASVEVWGGQLEVGELSEYMPSTNERGIRLRPLINGQGRLLSEVGSTNYIKRSESFENSYWSKNDCIAIDNVILGPDGKLSASVITATGSNAHIVRSEAGLSSVGQVKSIYAKLLSGGGEVRLLSTGSDDFNFTLTDEWQRFEVPVETTAVTEQFFYGVDFRGGNTTSVAIWGGQLEYGENAGTYISSNSGTTTTRLTDSITGAGDISVFNSNEGSLFFELASLVDGIGDGSIISLNDGTNNNYIELVLSGTLNRVFVRSSNAVNTIYNNNTDKLQLLKYVITYTNTQVSFYISGQLIGRQDLSSPLSGLSEIKLSRGSGDFNLTAFTQQIRYVDRILTDYEINKL